MNIDEIINLSSNYIKNQDDLNLIRKAYEFSKEKHINQYRKSGEPYINHPLEVSKILIDLKSGPIAICAGLLHDVVEDTGCSKEELAKEFNEEIANIVDGVTKIGKINFVSMEQKLANNHRKMIIAMSKDFRVILVKLADRLHNMRTLNYMSKDKQVRISTETLEIYVPLSHRFGINNIKAELEDLALKYINNIAYEDVINKLDTFKIQRKQNVLNMEIAIKSVLNNSNVYVDNIKSRVKNIYSIHKKMIKKNKEFNEIYDIFAIRIITENIEECYKVLGIIHSKWVPIPNRFKDYIAMPKPNMYQSLHTTILGENGIIYEIQIRTLEMDQTAELGIAAHWSYKEGKQKSSKVETEELVNKFKWFKEILDKNVEYNAAEDFMGAIKHDLLSANIYVFTPKGEIFNLTTGATPLDFAYKVHTEIGHKTIGTNVNGRMVPFNYILKTGDIIEIRTSNKYVVNRSWLKVVTTTYAKHKIKNYLNKEDKDKYIKIGIKELEKNLKIISKTLKDVDNDLVEIKYKGSTTNINHVEKLYFEIGIGRLKATDCIRKLFDNDDQIFEIKEEKIKPTKVSVNGIIVEGNNNFKLKISQCCQPIPGDDIVGYISKNNGITIHDTKCKNISNLNSDKFLDVEWDSKFQKNEFYTRLKIMHEGLQETLTSILNLFNKKKIVINGLQTKKDNNENSMIYIDIKINNKDLLHKIIGNIKSMEGIISVDRFKN